MNPFLDDKKPQRFPPLFTNPPKAHLMEADISLAYQQSVYSWTYQGLLGFSLADYSV
jgi:hypothetical protein